MKGVLLILPVFLVALLATPAPAAQPLRLLVIGDSLARGFYTTQPGEAFVTRVAVALHAAETMVRPAPRLSDAERRWAQQTEAWDLVILEIGLNDSRPQMIDDPEWAARYVALAASITSSGARLVCVTPFNMGDMPERDSARAEMIRTSCSGGIVADVYAATQGRDDLRAPLGAPTFVDLGEARDGEHPNNAGHAVVAATILEALTTQVSLPLLQQSHLGGLQ